VRYDEREVNAIVGAFFNDHAAIRRYLVDEGSSTAKGASTGVRAAASTRNRVDAVAPHPVLSRRAAERVFPRSAVRHVHDEMMR
jgi:Uncharacterized protein conserved in bacteria (DUF2087)